MTEQAKNPRAQLYQKIAVVTAAVGRIPKNGFNSFHQYKYATESDITDGLRDLLMQNGLAFLPPSVLEWQRDETIDNPKTGPRTRVLMRFEIADADTGEVYSARLWGEGQDNGDKGFYKAYTGAVKYFLMKTFLIATGDDPEQDHRPTQAGGASFQQAQQAAPQRHAPPAQPQRPAAPAPPTNGEQPPFCPVHNKPMRVGKNGGYFCATKDAASGEWCKARPGKSSDDTAEWDAIDAAAAARR